MFTYSRRVREEKKSIVNGSQGTNRMLERGTIEMVRYCYVHTLNIRYIWAILSPCEAFFVCYFCIFFHLNFKKECYADVNWLLVLIISAIYHAGKFAGLLWTRTSCKHRKKSAFLFHHTLYPTAAGFLKNKRYAIKSLGKFAHQIP